MWARQAALCRRKLPRNVHLGYLMCAARDYRLLTVACCAEAMHTLQWTARPLAVPWAHHSARGVSVRRATVGTVMCSTGMCHDEQARLHLHCRNCRGNVGVVSWFLLGLRRCCCNLEQTSSPPSPPAGCSHPTNIAWSLVEIVATRKPPSATAEGVRQAPVCCAISAYFQVVPVCHCWEYCSRMHTSRLLLIAVQCS